MLWPSPASGGSPELAPSLYGYQFPLVLLGFRGRQVTMLCPSSPQDRLMADNTGTGGKGEGPGWVVASSLRTHRSGLPFLGQLLPSQARTCGVRALDADLGGHLSPTIPEGARTCSRQAHRRKRSLEPLVDQPGHPSHPCLVSHQTHTLCTSGDRPPGQTWPAGGADLTLPRPSLAKAEELDPRWEFHIQQPLLGGREGEVGKLWLEGR